jgi:hypothetical protein
MTRIRFDGCDLSRARGTPVEKMLVVIGIPERRFP